MVSQPGSERAALLFVVTLCGGLLGLVYPTAFGNATDRTIGLWLCAAAVVAGLVLYFPRILLAAKVTDLATIGSQTKAVQTAILGSGGNDNRFDTLDTSVAALRDQVTGIATTLDPLRRNVDAILAQLNVGGAARTSLDSLVTGLSTMTDLRTRLDDLTARLNAGGDIRGKLDAIAAQFNDGGGVRTKLDAIEAKIKPS